MVATDNTNSVLCRRFAQWIVQQTLIIKDLGEVKILKNLKKAVAGLAIAAVLALGGAFVTHAQYYGAYNPPGVGPYNPPGYGGIGAARYDPISQWIVLSGLFYPQVTTGGGTSGTTSGAARYDPISQWIVLGGLFGY